jgi:hypothetical protein
MTSLKVVAEKYMPNPYPEPVDDGTWEGEGGYVAKPNHQMWAMEWGGGAGLYGSYISYPETVFIMHPLSYAEYQHALDKVKGFFE